jgi:hypothetical protein
MRGYLTDRGGGSANRGGDDAVSVAAGDRLTTLVVVEGPLARVVKLASPSCAECGRYPSATLSIDAMRVRCISAKKSVVDGCRGAR